MIKIIHTLLILTLRSINELAMAIRSCAFFVTIKRRADDSNFVFFSRKYYKYILTRNFEALNAKGSKNKNNQVRDVLAADRITNCL